MDMSERWETYDKDIQFYHNFSDVRVAIKLTVDGTQIQNNTITENSGFRQLGHNLVLNDSEISDSMMMSWVINAKNKPNKYHYHKLKFIGQRCWGPCQPPV